MNEQLGFFYISVPDLLSEDHEVRHVLGLVLQGEEDDLCTLFDLWHHLQLSNQPKNWTLKLD